MQDTDRERKITLIYEKLLDFFGPQGWWPVYSDRGPGYHPSDFSYPKTERQMLEISFGAILTQNTSWKNAEKALLRLISEGLLDLKRIAEADSGTLESLIRSSGYFRQKALRLKGFSSFVLREHGDIENLLSLDVRTLRNELLSVKGIGKETADSIILYAARKPKFVVDAYTFRIAERTGIFGERDYGLLQGLFEGSLPKKHEIYNEYHALLVELGKEYCGKTPDCSSCPLKPICIYNKKA